MSAVGAVTAVYRPRRNTIAVWASGAPEPVELEIAEARAIHGAIGGALAIADCRADPRAAVPGAGQ